MTQRYSDCFFCGGVVQERHITREVWRAGALHLIENVPIGICNQCGERYIHPEVARRIDGLLENESTPDHFVRVPAYCFREAGPGN